MTPLANFLGLLVAIVSNLLMLPQIYRIYKDKAAKDVSRGMILIYIITQSLWIMYSLAASDYYLYVSSIVAIIIAISLGVFYWWYEIHQGGLFHCKRCGYTGTLAPGMTTCGCDDQRGK